MATITINGTVTLDESLGLQNSASVAAGDKDDSDVSLATLQTGASAFYNRLFNSVATGGLGLSTTFATNNGVAESADNLITVSGGTVSGLGFVDGNGGTLPVYAGVATGGVATGLSAVNGGTISLFADATLGNRMVLGVDANNDIVFAIFMDPTKTDLSQARVWMAQFEAISNPITTNPDDAVNLFDSIGVGATTSLNFTFDALHSGSNLFGVVGDVNNSIIVIGAHPVLKADGTLGSGGEVIKTSQGGTGATIGVNSQMFDPGEGAFFTYVKGSVPDFLAGNLDQTEANDSASIQYTGGTNASTGASTTISQIQGNSLASMKITAFDIGDSPQTRAFVDGTDGLGTGAHITITSVHVFNASNTDVTGNKVTLNGDGSATVSGLDSGFRIEWTTSAPHDRVLIEGVAGKFDIGAFGITQATPSTTDIGQQLTFEDDGPSIAASATGAATLTVDESDLTTDKTGSFAGQFTATFGTDGQGGTGVTYKLSIPSGPSSGLTDTLTNEAVVLSANASGSQVVGTTATTGLTVFVVSVDASGTVTLDQQRAIVHTNPNDPDESRALGNAGDNKVVLTAKITDGDADPASAPLDLTPLLVFKDDGPTVTLTATTPPTLTVDESDLTTDKTGSFAGQFTATFGADGDGGTGATYKLSIPGGTASGLTDTATNQSVVLSVNASGSQVTGKTATSGVTVFVVSVDASGNVTLDQQRAIVHTNPNDPDESRGLTGTNLVVLTATATDKDGDHASASLDLTPQLVFKDDGPSIGPIANSIVDFTSGAMGTATKSLVGVVGNDPNTAPYNIDSFSPTSLTINGTLLTGVESADKQTVTYFADTNSNGIIDTGETKFYQLTLSETANSGAGSYTFTVLQDPPPAELSFTFDQLHSGSNLFGTVGDAANALNVIGEHPVLKADGTLDSSGNAIKTSQGGTGATIGVDSQMFDPGEGAYFTYIKTPVADFLGANLSQTEANNSADIQYNGGTNPATSASTTISQTQGNSLASMKITAFDIGDSPQGRDFVDGSVTGNGLGTGTPETITSVRVFNANGVKIEDTDDLAHFNDPTVVVSNLNSGAPTVSGLASDFKIAWTTSAAHDRVLIEGVAGKFDIGAFAITQAQPTPDQKLDFVARATDGDGDFKTASFSIGIDGTGANHDGHVVGVG